MFIHLCIMECGKKSIQMKFLSFFPAKDSVATLRGEGFHFVNL